MQHSISWSCITLVLVTLQSALAYRNYYIEDECVSPNVFQKISFRLPASGPDSVGEMRSNRFGTYSRTGRNCLLTLTPPKGYGVIITVVKVDFRNPQDCKDFIKLYSKDGEDKKLCGYQELGLEGETYFSDQDVNILYHTTAGGMGFNNGVRLIFTVTKLGEDADACSAPMDFKCKNSHCIWAGVACDGINNCGDASDENSLEHPHCSEVTPVAIAAVVLGITSFVAIIVALCLCCCRAHPDKPLKPPLIDDFPLRPRHGYYALPEYSYGSFNHSPATIQTRPSPMAYPSAPTHCSQPNSSVPFVQQKVEIRYDRPPPYRS